MIINQKNHIVSEWNEELEYYINSWKGFINEPDFIEAVEVGRKFMIENKVKYHLADTTNMEGGWDGGEWLYENFWKDVTSAGLKYFGIIVPDTNVFSVASDMLMQDELNDRGVELIYKTFSNLKDAEDWIRSLRGDA